MDITKKIAPMTEINPTVYAYTIPDYPKRDGWVKIGYTNRDAQKRIDEQTKTAGIDTRTLWSHYARYNTGGYFTDHEFHNYLERNKVEREKGREWFYFGSGQEMLSEDLFMKFTFQKYDDLQKGIESTYVLRKEQELAVEKALEYAKENPGGEFLWNAKPRFGKTLSAYDFARRFDAQTVLIVTNRPAIANSWYDDFEEFIAWQTDYKFVSESSSLIERPTLTSKEFGAYNYQKNEEARRIEFISLQDLKGSVYHGGKYDKLEWVTDINWDLLIIDEAHEGVDTLKTDMAFDQIKRKFTLHLSGTPFKAIAKGNFNEEQIYNWSYADEQTAKENWDGENRNPYEELPKLNMFTYQMSHMIMDEVNKGAEIEGEGHDYAFDLNEFFSTKPSGRFVYEEDIKKWLDTLTTNYKYPFSTPQLRNELKHTFWILERVDSAKELGRLLKRHPVFENYEIIVAAGDGRFEDYIEVNERSLDRVKDAIKNHDKTITLSVGQLTTGVTIPEWTAVMMLSNMKSPAMYMQAAFRSQNPHKKVEKINNKDVLYLKENAYVFDFAPERTLTIFDEFANDLLVHTSSGGGTMGDREENIKTLLNFFPVIGEDNEGEMKELDYQDVITIPGKIKATEVVKRGFMSNLLFANISRVFAAPQVVLDTLDKLKPEQQGKLRQTDKKVDTQDIELDDQEEVKIDAELVINQTKASLGNKVYDVKKNIPDDIINDPQTNLIKRTTKEILDSDPVKDIFENTKEVTGVTNRELNKAKKKMKDSLDLQFEQKIRQKNIDEKRLKRTYEKELEEDLSSEEKEKITNNYNEELKTISKEFTKDIEDTATETVEVEVQDFVEETIKKEENNKKSQVEEDVRSRLRGFARTIPSFIMAYGKEDLCLENFDQYIPAEVFKEVTGITIDQFIFLRDGGPYEEDGENKHFEGRLFDEVVFDKSIQEFLNKRSELSDYFEELNEDIFDYIPPQETNQIYTPKKVVLKMVEDLEKENPGIYDDSSKTFIDIYMKSGLYITEIVKKLYNSRKIKKEISDDLERIKHILENQVYGFAPSEIIYNISTNFIFGELGSSISRDNFHAVDTTPYAKAGTMQKLIDETFGN